MPGGGSNGTSKLYSVNTIDSVILRFGNAYGAVEADITSRIIPQLLHNAIRGLPLLVFGGKQSLDFVHVDDVVRAMMAAISMLDIRRYYGSNTSESGDDDTDPSVPGYYADIIRLDRCVLDFNIGSGEVSNVRDIVSMIVEKTKSRSEILFLPADPKAADAYATTTDKSRRLLGYQPEVTMSFPVYAFGNASA